MKLFPSYFVNQLTRYCHWSNLWRLALLAVAALVALPVVLVGVALFAGGNEVWDHLLATRLSDYVGNSLLLAGGVALGSVVLGVSCAWCVTYWRFPGQVFFQWALLLPMAMPAYVAAYAYTDLAEFAGPLQTLLRSVTGWQRGDYWFPEIRSLLGAIAVMSLVLYPYVFLTTRAALLAQGTTLSESAASLGAGPWRRLWRVSLPLARPAIVGGALLVVMEALTDYGTVDYFAIDTFTTGIYRTWHGLYDYQAACKLAAILLVAIMMISLLERLSRGHRGFHRTGQRQQRREASTLFGLAGWAACSWCALPIVGGFIVPAVVLASRAGWSANDFSRMAGPASTSFLLAVSAAAITVVAALFLAYGKRCLPGRLPRWTATIAGFGYAVPGSVVAIAIIVPFAWLDNQVLSPVMSILWSTPPQLWLSGSLFILLFAYVVRFLAVSLATIEPGLQQITPSQDAAARSLGLSAMASLRRLHLPLLRASIGTAALMVMVDVLKELPATMILRPFNVQTLAVAVHDQVSQESLADAALPALSMVLVGLAPVLLLTRSIQRRLVATTATANETPAQKTPAQDVLAVASPPSPLLAATAPASANAGGAAGASASTATGSLG